MIRPIQKKASCEGRTRHRNKQTTNPDPGHWYRDSWVACAVPYRPATSLAGLSRNNRCGRANPAKSGRVKGLFAPVV